ncbi:MAG: hypothetical protein V4550_01815 [Gemmatimonadota bacterium]
MMIVTDVATGLTETLVSLAKPWSKLYSDSKSVSAGVLFLHLAPLIFGAGTAFVTDQLTLRASRLGASERVQQLRVLAAAHRMVIAGLAISVISGLLLFFGDVETFIGSIYFWIKLSCVALLLINGFVMTRTEKALAVSPSEALWGRLRTLAVVSMVLWMATALAGVVLKEFA